MAALRRLTKGKVFQAEGVGVDQRKRLCISVSALVCMYCASSTHSQSSESWPTEKARDGRMSQARSLMHS